MQPTTRLLIDLGFGEKYRRLRLCSAFLLYFLILAVGSIPGARQDIGQVASGIILHAAAYSTITFLLYTGYAGTSPRKAIQAIAMVAAMGALDELIQSFLPYRTGAVSDWVVDITAGVVTASILAATTGEWLRKSRAR